MDRRPAAKKLLVHYFRTLFKQAGLEFDADNKTEVELIIDLVIEAAIMENEPFLGLK